MNDIYTVDREYNIIEFEAVIKEKFKSVFREISSIYNELQALNISMTSNYFKYIDLRRNAVDYKLILNDIDLFDMSDINKIKDETIRNKFIAANNSMKDLQYNNKNVIGYEISDMSIDYVEIINKYNNMVFKFDLMNFTNASDINCIGKILGTFVNEIKHIGFIEGTCYSGDIKFSIVNNVLTLKEFKHLDESGFNKIVSYNNEVLNSSDYVISDMNIGLIDLTIKYGVYLNVKIKPELASIFDEYIKFQDMLEIGKVKHIISDQLNIFDNEFEFLTTSMNMIINYINRSFTLQTIFESLKDYEKQDLFEYIDDEEVKAYVLDTDSCKYKIYDFEESIINLIKHSITSSSYELRAVAFNIDKADIENIFNYIIKNIGIADESYYTIEEVR